MLDSLAIPIVGAPMAGGASTPALAAAVSDAGGLGFLASGYKRREAMSEDIAATARSPPRRSAINVFAVTPTEADPAGARGVPRPARRRRRRAALGRRRLRARRSSGCSPSPSRSSRSRSAAPRRRSSSASAPRAARCGSRSPTSPRRSAAHAAGADALVVQGYEAGGHRGGFADDAPGDVGLLALLQLVGAALPGLPLVATGGIATGRAVAAVLAAGAAAAQVGTALMRAPEAATAPVHRDALAQPGRTAVTRAFTGRSARGIVNALPARARRGRAARLPRGAPHHRAAARPRARGGRRRDAAPVGRPGARADRRPARRRAGARSCTRTRSAAAAEAAARLGPVTD